MRLHFLLALLILIFTGCSNDFVRADQSIKAATRHGVRTPSQVTEGTQRSASVAEDETTTIEEERGGGDLPALPRPMSFTFEKLKDETSAAEALKSMSNDPLAMKVPQENLAALADEADAAKAVSSTSADSWLMRAPQENPSALANVAAAAEAVSSISMDVLLMMVSKGNRAAQEQILSFFLSYSKKIYGYPEDQNAIIAEASALLDSLDVFKTLKAALRTPTETAELKFTLAKPLVKEAINAVSSTSRDPLVMEALHKNPAAEEKLSSFAISLSQKNLENPEDQAAIIAEVNALLDSPDVANVLETTWKGHTGVAGVMDVVGKAFENIVAAPEAVSSTSQKPSVIMDLPEYAEVQKKIDSFLSRLSEMEYTMPKDQTAIRRDVYSVLDSLDLANVMKAALKNPTMTAQARAALAKEFAEMIAKFSSTSEDPWTKLALHENPAAEEKLSSFVKSLSQKNLENPEDQAAFIAEVDALLDSPDVANVLEAELKSPTKVISVSKPIEEALISF